MTKKLKSVGMAFAGMIIYTALGLIASYIFSDSTHAWLASALCFILLGGSYYGVILGRMKPEKAVDKKFLLTALGVVLFFTFVSMCTSTLILRNVYDTAYFEQYSAETGNNITVLSLIVSVFLAPVAEELAFRGCMFRFLSDLNKSAAIVISSLIFAAYHGTIVHMYAGFIGGIIFSCIYSKTHKLRYSMAAHCIYNLVTIILGCFLYPDFVTELWWVITVNSLLFIFLFILFTCESTVIADKPELTEAQKREREQTRKIVEDVFNEHKASK